MIKLPEYPKLEQGQRYRLWISEHDYIEVIPEEGGIEVRTNHGQLSVRPIVANGVFVTRAERP